MPGKAARRCIRAKRNPILPAMADPLTTPTRKMSRAEYRRWAEAQPRGRYERADGEVVAMAPERIVHAQAKAMAWLLLRQAVAAAGVKCQVLPDGITVEVDADTDYEPDALVNCGDRAPPDAIAAPNPVIVVEVVSPGSKSIDSGRKLADYFRVPSICHYLIVVTERRMVIHHRRGEAGAIDTRIVAAGMLTLDPPGIVLPVEPLFGE